MNELFQEILSVLKEECRCHEELLSLAMQQSGQIIKSEGKSLLENIEKMESLVKKIAKLESRRMALEDVLKKNESGFPESVITSLKALTEKLADAMVKLVSINKRNAMALNEINSYAHFQIALCTEEHQRAQRGNIYSPTTCQPAGIAIDGTI